MTRGQYIAMCMIGAVAIIAYLQSYQVARAMRLTPAGKQPMTA